MSNNPQIPKKLFLDLCEYFLWKEHPEFFDILTDEITEALQTKVDKILDHIIFTEYKCNSTPQIREQARKQYLDRRGIEKNYRTESEARS